MSENPFDKTEWPLGWMAPVNWHKQEFINAFHNWREKWEPVIAEAMLKAEEHKKLEELLDIYKSHYRNVMEWAVEAEKKVKLWEQYCGEEQAAQDAEFGMAEAENDARLLWEDQQREEANRQAEEEYRYG